MITSRLVRLSLAALVLSGIGCKAEEEELNHGIVKLEFRRGENEDDNPFVGTATVTATMEYRECLIDYYVNNPSQRQDGVDGELVFGTEEQGGEGWTDRLCEIEVPSQLDCTVESIEQQLDTGAPKMTVIYNVSGDIEGRQVAIGPFPDRDHAECMSGLSPEVRVLAGSTTGANSEGTRVWSTQTTNPSDAIVDQGKAITIYAALAAG